MFFLSEVLEIRRCSRTNTEQLSLMLQRKLHSTLTIIESAPTQYMPATQGFRGNAIEETSGSVENQYCFLKGALLPQKTGKKCGKE